MAREFSHREMFLCPVVSPTLFNIMMSDFAKSVSSIKTLLYADGISFYTQVKRLKEAELIRHPNLEEVYR